LKRKRLKTSISIQKLNQQEIEKDKETKVNFFDEELERISANFYFVFVISLF